MEGGFIAFLIIVTFGLTVSYCQDRREKKHDGTIGNSYKLICVHTDGVRKPSWFIRPEINGKFSKERYIGSSLRLVSPASAKSNPNLGFSDIDDAHKFMEDHKGKLFITFGSLKKKHITPVTKIAEGGKVYEL